MRPFDPDTFVRPSVRDLAPYVVERIPHRIKMDANENPFPWPSELLEAVMVEVGRQQLNRYPDPMAEDLRQLLSRRLQVDPSWIMLGNGSDELIQSILLALGGPGVKVLSPVPTFAMYEIIVKATGCQFVGVPLGEDLELDEEAMRRMVERERPRVLFLAYPNNPTGNCFRREAIEEILGEFEGIVVVDEAYFDFSRKTFLDLLEGQGNLLILRSLSKIGLAGLRIGILVGEESLVQAISKVRLPYNLNTFSQVAAQVVLSRDDFIARQVETLVAQRDRLFRALQRLPGVHPYPSEANFILFSAADGQKVFASLLEQEILVRAFGPSGLLKDHLRVTVGTPEENGLFLEALQGAL